MTSVEIVMLIYSTYTNTIESRSCIELVGVATAIYIITTHSVYGYFIINDDTFNQLIVLQSSFLL